MPKTSIKSFAIDIVGILVLIAALTFGGRPLDSASVHRSAAESSKPQVILWAWERPVDLRFIDRQKVAVAYLAKSITLKSDEVIVRPRVQPLLLPDKAKVIAVTRIETDRVHRPSLSNEQCARTIRSITELASLSNVSELQIDFDATQSERQFYRELLAGLRRELPPNTRLSITALASWCMSDDWISDLPVNEAVPMLFRMAADGKQILNRLNAGDDFSEPLCRKSLGISLDEPRPRNFPSRSLYFFNPDAWTETSVHKIMESPNE